MAEQKKKKKKNKADKKQATKIILPTDGETDEEEKLDEVNNDYTSRFILQNTKDVLLIYNALKNYKPAADEQA